VLPELAQSNCACEKICIQQRVLLQNPGNNGIGHLNFLDRFIKASNQDIQLPTKQLFSSTDTNGKHNSATNPVFFYMISFSQIQQCNE
jgi:hypothetical protein